MERASYQDDGNQAGPSGSAAHEQGDMMLEQDACGVVEAARRHLAASREQLDLVARTTRLREEQGKAGETNGTGRKRAKTQKTQLAQNATGRAGSKGLRHFAMQVCSKIEAKKLTSYSEVAEELVEELKADPDSQSQDDDKNIRRRVYDAFNVLLAVGIIAKEGKKDIVWKGFPAPALSNLVDLEAEQTRRMAVIEKKQQELQELINQHSMVKELLDVNPPRSAGDLDMALQIPFVLVTARPEATVEVSVSKSMEEVDFKFNAPFSLHDDSFVLKEMIRHYGSIRATHASIAAKKSAEPDVQAQSAEADVQAQSADASVQARNADAGVRAKKEDGGGGGEGGGMVFGAAPGGAGASSGLGAVGHSGLGSMPYALPYVAPRAGLGR
ncbi:hypothetical protein FOA52_011544 [Chlamydomonas sp. UWO 241]|nr:hypothetical protein FOA52_011544 [Chlamydomonas sp. UWO 241]